MIIWLDAQLPPGLARWINESFEGIEARHLREIGLRDPADNQIFEAARDQGCIVMTKDSDFVQLVADKNSPPKMIWITCGNTSNMKMREIMNKTLQDAITFFKKEKQLLRLLNSSFFKFLLSPLVQR